MNADFIALIVIFSTSSNVRLKFSIARMKFIRHSCITHQSIISINCNTELFSKQNVPNGWFSILSTAPVCTLLSKHISNGILLSRIYCANSPKLTNITVFIIIEILHKMSCMTYPVSTAPLYCLPD